MRAPWRGRPSPRSSGRAGRSRAPRASTPGTSRVGHEAQIPRDAPVDAQRPGALDAAARAACAGCPTTSSVTSGTCRATSGSASISRSSPLSGRISPKKTIRGSCCSGAAPAASPACRRAWGITAMRSGVDAADLDEQAVTAGRAVHDHAVAVGVELGPQRRGPARAPGQDVVRREHGRAGLRAAQRAARCRSSAGERCPLPVHDVRPLRAHVADEPREAHGVPRRLERDPRPRRAGGARSGRRAAARRARGGRSPRAGAPPRA